MMVRTFSDPPRRLRSAAFLFFALGLAGVATACTTASSSPGAAPSDAAAEAQQLLDRGARIVDVRTPGEFAGGHIDGAINIPVQELAQRLAELEPRDQPVVVYCRSGNRSGRAASLLRANGFAEVHDIKTQAGWPIR